nr:hypothetical protein [Streptomyces caatingaensis]
MVEVLGECLWVGVGVVEGEGDGVGAVLVEDVEDVLGERKAGVVFGVGDEPGAVEVGWCGWWGEGFPGDGVGPVGDGVLLLLLLVPGMEGGEEFRERSVRRDVERGGQCVGVLVGDGLPELGVDGLALISGVGGGAAWCGGVGQPVAFVLEGVGGEVDVLVGGGVGGPVDFLCVGVDVGEGGEEGVGFGLAGLEDGAGLKVGVSEVVVGEGGEGVVGAEFEVGGDAEGVEGAGGVVVVDGFAGLAGPVVGSEKGLG